MYYIVKILTVIGLIGLSIALIANTAYAAEDVQAPTNDKITNYTIVTDTALTSEDTVNGDVICLNERTEIKGNVNGDILCAAGVIVIEGTVAGDVRLAAEKVVIRGDIKGSATILASTLSIEDGAMVGGDITGLVQSATLNGRMGRDVLLTAETMTIGGTVVRDVNTSVKNLTITSDAQISGWVRHYGATSVDINEKASTGTVKAYDSKSSDQSVTVPFAVVASILLTIGLTAIAITALLPRVMQYVADVGNASLLVTLLTGVSVVVFFPLLLIVLLVIGVSALLAAIGGLAWLLALALSIPVAIHVVGDRITNDQTTNILLKTVIGAGVVLVLFVLPIVNIIAIPLLIILGAGSLARAVISGAGKPKYRIDDQEPRSADA